MGVIDYFAKRKGYILPTKKRGFNAAGINRLTSSWTTQPKPADADIKANLRVLRARSRDLAQNNDYARRFLSLTRSNVIGPKGIILQARSKDNGKLDKVANDAIENSWSDWCKWGTPDVTGQHSWKTLLDLYITTMAKDGEVLVLQHRTWKGNKYRYALEFVDVEALDVDLNVELKGGNYIKMGIEFNSMRRPVNYYLLSGSKSADSYGFGPKKYQKIPARRVIHRFLSDSVWQSRGVPWMASTMMRLQMLGGYEEAELVSARVASSKMGFFESEGAEEYTGDDTDEDGNIITDATPGTFEQLPPGMKFSAFDPTHPSTAYDSFVKGCLRGVGAGVGVSYHTLANDLSGVNYSSGRLGALEDREIWKSLQDITIESFCEIVFQSWLENSLLTGIYTESGGRLKTEKLEKYSRVTWQPRRWAWVDPLKDIQANINGIDSVITSISEVVRERGRDPAELFEEIAAERQLLKDLNIVLNTKEKEQEDASEKNKPEND